MINYTQEITNLDIDNTDPTRPNLIKGVHVLLTARDDTDNLSSSIGIFIGLEPGETFVPFENLTKETVESWIKDSPNIENAKPLLVQQIEAERENAVIRTTVPPWVVPVKSVPLDRVVEDTNIVSTSNTGTTSSETVSVISL